LIKFGNTKFWYVDGSGVWCSNLVPGLGPPFFRSRHMWSFTERDC